MMKYLAARLGGLLIDRVSNVKNHNFWLGPKDNPQMLRWYVVPRNKLFNVYLHFFRYSDLDEMLHDHPYLFNISFILLGGYDELTIDYGGAHRVTPRKSGGVVWRFGRAPHRVLLAEYGFAWTLFITGPIVRTWGFHCPKGWKPYTEIVDYTTGINKGCE